MASLTHFNKIPRRSACFDSHELWFSSIAGAWHIGYGCVFLIKKIVLAARQRFYPLLSQENKPLDPDRVTYMANDIQPIQHIVRGAILLIPVGGSIFFFFRDGWEAQRRAKSYESLADEIYVEMIKPDHSDIECDVCAGSLYRLAAEEYRICHREKKISEMQEKAEIADRCATINRNFSKYEADWEKVSSVLREPIEDFSEELEKAFKDSFSKIETDFQWLFSAQKELIQGSDEAVYALKMINVICHNIPGAVIQFSVQLIKKGKHRDAEIYLNIAQNLANQIIKWAEELSTNDFVKTLQGMADDFDVIGEQELSGDANHIASRCKTQAESWRDQAKSVLEREVEKKSG